MRGSSSTYRTVFCIVIALASGGCRYDPHHHTYLENAPPEEQIRGTWVIDVDHTTWGEVKSLIEDGSIDPQSGYLEIRKDETFVIEDLPDFSTGRTVPLVSKYSDSGTWWIDLDRMNNLAYLWFQYDSGDDTSSRKKSASAYFRADGDKYLLHVIIDDPDTGEAFVLRKMDE